METKWKRKLTFFSVGMFFFMGGVEYAVILPTLWLYIKTDFHAQEYMLGLLLSGYSFAAIISGPILGRWSDRTRRPKFLVVLGIVFQVAGNIMYFMGISVWFLLGSRLVAGVGGGAESVVMAEVTRFVDEERRTGIISVLVAIRQTGLLVGPALNLFLREMDFTVYGFHVNKYNVPGAFMACAWVIQMFIFLIFFTDLEKFSAADGFSKSSQEGSPVVTSADSGYHGNTSRVDYDEDIYKELVDDNADRRSINSAASSRSPAFNPDNLIETAEDYIVEGPRSRSQTPKFDHRLHEKHSNIHNSPLNTGRPVTENGASSLSVAIETGYGAVDSSTCIPSEDGQNCRGSREYIYSRESSIVDFSHGKLRFMYQGM